MNQDLIGGKSFLFNSLFILLNISGAVLVLLAFLPNYNNQQFLFLIIGCPLIVLSILGMFVFEGKNLFSIVLRFIIGFLFILSGLIKANDPIGFSYKLKEFLDDGALAYRVREIFSIDSFSLEFLQDSALTLSVIIILIELIIGVMIFIGGRIRIKSIFLFGVLFFFTFLTWHSASCDSKEMFTNTFLVKEKNEQERYLNLSKVDKNVRIIDQNAESFKVKRVEQVQCVTDCGCFGDAFRYSFGRSLTPLESFFKDIFLIYLAIWLLVTSKRDGRNSVKMNIVFLSASIIGTLFFALLFNWYFLVLIFLGANVFGLWILRSGGKYLGNYWGASLSVGIFSIGLIFYSLLFGTPKDFRGYAEGENIQKGRVVNGKHFLNEFYIAIEGIEVSEDEKNLSFLKSKYESEFKETIELLNLSDSSKLKIDKFSYSKNLYPDSIFKIERIDTVNSANINLDITKDVLNSSQFVIFIERDLVDISKESVQELLVLIKLFNKSNIEFLMVTNSSRDIVDSFKTKFNCHLPIFGMDENELKIMSRSKHGVMLLEKGIVLDKYEGWSYPSVNDFKNTLIKWQKK